jgi:ribonuclease III
MNQSLEDLEKNIFEIEKKIDVEFDDKKLIILAFVHSSFANENKSLISEHNERLEFLGDSILNLIVSDYLYSCLPSSNEGKLSALRSNLIDASSCAKYMTLLKIDNQILLGKGEELSFERGKESILADGFEAVMGAVFLDKGFLFVKEFFLNNFKNIIDEIIQTPQINHKANLQEYCQKKYKKTPRYVVVKEIGPEHLKVFHVAAYINDKEVGIGEGKSKKIAEQRAASDALLRLEKEML